MPNTERETPRQWLGDIATQIDRLRSIADHIERIEAERAELLQACKAALEFIEHADYTEWVECDYAIAETKQLRAAIQKATNE